MFLSCSSTPHNALNAQQSACASSRYFPRQKYISLSHTFGMCSTFNVSPANFSDPSNLNIQTSASSICGPVFDIRLANFSMRKKCTSLNIIILSLVGRELHIQLFVIASMTQHRLLIAKRSEKQNQTDNYKAQHVHVSTSRVRTAVKRAESIELKNKSNKNSIPYFQSKCETKERVRKTPRNYMHHRRFACNRVQLCLLCSLIVNNAMTDSFAF